ncbi:hypothetical protein RHECNPAF_1360050 [Rhizobium etli CNPAF512]|nr:hypothetical protein RHECNPAF_1360050 [Rhizobium etli CNPAF512]
MDELRRIGTDENDEPPLGGEGAQHQVDFPLGLDVDAARRIVEEQNGRIERQPLGQRHLLLVAAGKRLHRASGIALDRQAAGEIGDQAAFRRQVAQPIAGEPSERGQDEIGGDRVRQHQSLMFAVGRHIDDARRIRRADTCRQTGISRYFRPGSRRGNRAIEPEQQVFLPLSHQPADTDDLAGAGEEADMAHHAGGKILDVDAYRAGHGGDTRREQVASLATDHQADQPLAIDAGERLVGRDAAVFQHRDMRAERLHLVEAVGNIEKGGAATLERFDEAGKDAGFMGGERRGWFVQNEHARLAEQRLGDLDHLTAAKRQIGDRHVERFGEPDHIADLSHAVMQRCVVDQAEPARKGAGSNVFGNRQAGRQAQLLLNHGDAGRARCRRAEARDRLVVDKDGSAVRLQGAGQEIDQRRLAGAVFTEQGVNPARQKGDVDALQNGIAEKSLEHLPGFQQGPFFRHDGIPQSGLLGGKQLVEERLVVIRIDITVSRELVGPGEVAADGAVVDDGQRHLDEGGNILALQRLHSSIDGKRAKPVRLHGRPALQALLLPQFQELPGIFAGCRHLVAALALEGEDGAGRQRAAERQHAVDIGIGEEQTGHRFLCGRDVIFGIGLGDHLEARIGIEDRLGALAAIIADRNAGRAVHDDDLALAAELADHPFGSGRAPFIGIGVDLRCHLVGVHKAVEIDDGDALVAGIRNDAVERVGGAGDDDDGIDIGVDHRLYMLDLCLRIALRVRDHQVLHEAGLLQLIHLGFDGAFGLLHPSRHRIDVRPADRIGRLPVALDAIGGGRGRARGKDEEGRGSGSTGEKAAAQ